MFPIDPMVLGPLIGLTLADPGQRETIETAIADGLRERGIIGGSVWFDADLESETASELGFSTPEETAHVLIAIIAGELGIVLDGYDYPFTRQPTPVFQYTDGG